MEKNVDEENAHNHSGAPPSDFSDIPDFKLRSQNRGAVLANIFERYVTGGKLLPKEFAICVREINNYINMFPKREVKEARYWMIVHLNERGYQYAA